MWYSLLSELFPSYSSAHPPSSPNTAPPVHEHCFLYAHLSVCLPSHQTHPQWASVWNSKVKTHYSANSPLVMLSNDLISLSVSPVSHRRPHQLSRTCPPALLALRHRRLDRCDSRPVSDASDQKQDRNLNLWKKICHGGVTGDTEGKRIWNERARYFI